MSKGAIKSNAKAKAQSSSITLYPPFETEGDLNPTTAGKDENENSSRSSNSSSNMFLSRELKRNFDTVCDIHQTQLHKKRLKKMKMKRGKEDLGIGVAMSMDNHNDNMDDNDNHNDDDEEEEEDLLDAKKFEAAVAAAVTAESEISTLAKGIVELENMLLLQTYCERGRGREHEHEPLELSSTSEEKEEKDSHIVSGHGNADNDANSSSSDGTPEKFPVLSRKVILEEEDG